MGPCRSKDERLDNQEIIQNGKAGSGTTKMSTNPDFRRDVTIQASNFVKEKSEKVTDLYDFLSPPLGAGAFGEVVKAKYKPSGEFRAVKKILKSAQSKEEQEKLANEVDILRGLDHPNIIKIYEFYQDEKFFYIVTELCTGGELFDSIVASKSFTEKKAARIIQQVLSAISYCHTNKIVHRDLKPENLLLDKPGDDATIKVIDFGLSRVFDPNKKMRHKLGTVYYIAPEVLQCQYDEKCDVWSCGVITFIMLCGYPPFNGQADEQIIKKIEKGEFNFNGKAWASVSQAAKDFITKMLVYFPERRYTAQEALADPWLTSLDDKNIGRLDQPLVNEAFSNLQSFRADQKLAQATYIFIVSYLTTKEEKESLMQLFRTLDKNGDGYLSKEELIEGYTKIYGERQAREMTAHLMATVDTNRSGKIDYSEFVVAAMNKANVNSKEKLEAAFRAFDTDNNGYITADELKRILGDKGSTLSDDAWNQVIKEVDANGDGKISLKEFKDMMLKSMQQ